MAELDFSDLPEAPLEGVLEVARPVTIEHVSAQLAKVEALQTIQDQILIKTGEIVSNGLSFAEIDPDAKEPPEKWVKEMGLQKATEKFRTARYNLMSAKEAPVGTKLAAQIYVGIVRAKATEKGGAPRLNIEKVIMVESAPREYPRQELENE